MTVRSPVTHTLTIKELNIISLASTICLPVGAVAEMGMLEDWVSWRDTAKNYNMSSLLRNNSIAGT